MKISFSGNYCIHVLDAQSAMQLSPRKTCRDEGIVLGVDVGTSYIKCYAYDRFTNIIGKANEKIPLLRLCEGRLEIPPDDLWRDFQNVINECLLSSHLHANQVTCLGISTQRGTFITWHRDTGASFHNFISWKDQRAEDIADQWNRSLLMMILRFGAFLLYIFTCITKFQVYGLLKFSSAMVLTRLFWVLEHCPQIRKRCLQNKVMFGTMDTWLLWKLTGGKTHVTDSSNACVTGFFDPFKLQWSNWILRLFGIPRNILPEIKNTCDTFGETLPSIFGSSIPICCLVGDQQASAFGAGCFQKYDVICTMGTGSFLSINTGSSPTSSAQGIFPLVGWTICSKATYVAECGVHDTGPTISWMQNLGLYSNPEESNSIALSVKDTSGVYFLPVRVPLQVTGKDADASFVGLNLHTSKEHLVRSVLESLAFQVGMLFHALSTFFGKKVKINSFKLCGGVARNDLIVQTISNITGHVIHRMRHRDTSSLGAALLAGLHYGIWSDQDIIAEVLKDSDRFAPNQEAFTNLNSFKKWKRILEMHSNSIFTTVRTSNK